MEKILNASICDILSQNEELVTLAIEQRSKFEGWLKFELACKLKSMFSDTKVEYPLEGKHIDLYSDGSLIEIKTPNTNYRVNTVEEKTRPITKNVNGIIDDIVKLQPIKEYPSYIAFVMFPIDNEKNKFKMHIDKIKAKLNCSQHIIEKFITIHGINVLVFTAKVK